MAFRGIFSSSRVKGSKDIDTSPSSLRFEIRLAIDRSKLSAELPATPPENTLPNDVGGQVLAASAKPSQQIETKVPWSQAVLSPAGWVF